MARVNSCDKCGTAVDQLVDIFADGIKSKELCGNCADALEEWLKPDFKAPIHQGQEAPEAAPQPLPPIKKQTGKGYPEEQE